jgi:hypothetical protein
MKTTLFVLAVCFALWSSQAAPPQKSLINPVLEGAITGTNVTSINLGNRNEVSPGVTQPTIVGGELNFIDGPYSDYSAIFGGSLNTIGPGTQSAAIIGGDYNIVQSGIGSAAVGGLRNETYGDSYNFLGGGSYNHISVNCGWASILVGDSCAIDGVPGSDYHFIAGGYHNTTAPPAKYFVTILGGQNNKAAASETWVIGSRVTNTAPSSVEIGLQDSAKVRVTATGVIVFGMPIIMQDTNGMSYTKIYTQNGQIYAEPME